MVPSILKLIGLSVVAGASVRAVATAVAARDATDMVSMVEVEAELLPGLLRRPTVNPWPHHPGHAPAPWSPPRCKKCTVKARGGGQDDAGSILRAFQQCNNGGTVVLDGSYTIGSPLDLTFLRSVDVALVGTVTFTNDIPYWVQNSFKYAFQDQSTFWKIGGSDVNIFGNGKGVLDGNGQPWYNEAPYNATLLRPMLLSLDGLQGGTVSGIKMINSPNWFNLIANSSNIVVSDMYLHAYSTNATVAPRNTDGWDTYRADNIVLQNSIIDNTDDCVSFKPNSTNIVVQGLSCNGSHGISVGSLGQYLGEVDVVENIYVYNNTLSNASDGARLKVWPGAVPGANATNVGGGSGYVRNVTYLQLGNTNNDWAIEVNQCYGVANTSICQQYPSSMVMEDIYFYNIYGTTSKKYDPKVGTLVCSAPEVCRNFVAKNVSVTPPSGKPPQWICNGFDSSGLEGFNCVPK